MIDSKAQVVGEILKLDKPFKPRHIWEPTGISRQLLNNYLQSFLSKGILTKQGGNYVILDRERLIDEMMSGPHRNKLQKPENTSGHTNLVPLGNLADIIIAARMLQNEVGLPLTRVLNDEIDAQMNGLKLLKRYLNNKQMMPSVAAKEWKDSGGKSFADVMWKIFPSEISEYYPTKEDFVHACTD